MQKEISIDRNAGRGRVYRLASFCHCAVSEGWKIAVRRYREQERLMKLEQPQTIQNVLPEAERKRQEQTAFPRWVTFSVLVPIRNDSEEQIRKLYHSMEKQTYSRWELCFMDEGGPGESAAEETCKSMAKGDIRIRYCRTGEKSRTSSETDNGWMNTPAGDYFMILRPGDVLHPSALFHYMSTICENQADVIYADEADYDEDSGKITNARFKPDFAPDSLRGSPYPGNGIVFSRELAERCQAAFQKDPCRVFPYELMLWLTERAEWICHIPRILYFRNHSRAEEKTDRSQRDTEARMALERHLLRTGMKGTVSNSYAEDTYRIRYEIEGDPLVSILIPNRDHGEDLRKCVHSILEKTTWDRYEILIIENGSVEEKTSAIYKELRTDERIRILCWNRPFNFSGINNYAASKAEGEYLLFLNNDTEVMSPDWIQEMLMFAQRDDVGAVGAKLYYPDGTIQHAGIGVGLMHSVGHFHRRMDGKQGGYMGRLAYAQNLSAVTGACMMVSRKIYENTGGMDESFPLVFNDVDYCLKLRKAGYLIVWTAFAELLHYESKTRGPDLETPEKQAFFRREARRFQNRWDQELTKGDPYYNPNLTLNREDFSTEFGSR